MINLNSLKVILGIILIFLISYSRENLSVSSLNRTELINNDIPLYLPEKKAVKFLTLGYEQFTANLLWFSTINYFGEKFLSKEAMPWFNHQCDLVTDLDPRARHVFEFCGTLLSWIAHEPENAKMILSKGISYDPDYWRFYYLRGFMSWYFQEDLKSAQEDFTKASNIEGAPPFLVSLASRLMVKHQEEDNAILFLKASYSRTDDPNARQAIGEKLNLAIVARDIRKLEEGLNYYQEKFNTYPLSLNELKASNIFKGSFVDPFGDEYQYDSDNFEIFSINGGKGLDFKGKTINSKKQDDLS